MHCAKFIQILQNMSRAKINFENRCYKELSALGHWTPTHLVVLREGNVGAAAEASRPAAMRKPGPKVSEKAGWMRIQMSHQGQGPMPSWLGHGLMDDRRAVVACCGGETTECPRKMGRIFHRSLGILIF